MLAATELPHETRSSVSLRLMWSEGEGGAGMERSGSSRADALQTGYTTSASLTPTS